jgi:hypothetical protein
LRRCRAVGDAALDHDEPGPVGGVVLDARGDQTKSIATGRRSRRNRTEARRTYFAQMTRGAGSVVEWHRLDAMRREPVPALGKRLRVRDRALDGAVAGCQQAMADRVHVLGDHAQSPIPPKAVVDLLDNARQRVLDRQHGAVDSPRRQLAKDRLESGVAERSGAGTDRPGSLLRIGARFALVGDLHVPLPTSSHLGPSCGEIRL